MVYLVEHRSGPNSLRLRLPCLLGLRCHVMRSAEEVTRDVPYYFVLKEWFTQGISRIEMFQYPGFLVIDLQKNTEKGWDEVLQEIMAKHEWKEVGQRIADPKKVWPYEDVCYDPTGRYDLTY